MSAKSQVSRLRRISAEDRAVFVHLVERLLKYKRANGLTFPHLAAKLGVSLPSVKAWVYKAYVAKPEAMERIKKLLSLKRAT
jgi:cyanate lyase